MSEIENHTLAVLRELRAEMRLGFEQVNRKIDRVEAELIAMRDREQSRSVDMNRLERRDAARDDRLRSLEDRMDRMEAGAN